MEAHDLDILVLGRQANVRYVTGAPQLWIAGTRPFGPVCVVVRASGDIYLNTTDDEGVPEEIGHDHLYGLTWNPMTLIDVLKKIDGAETALRVGTDAITPTFAALLPDAFPKAELVDGELAMRAARRIKTPDEIAVMGAAIRIAEGGLAAGVSRIASRVTRAETRRGGAGGDGRRRGQHARHAGRRLGDLARTSVATRTTERHSAGRRPGRLRCRRVGRRLRRRGGPDLADRTRSRTRHASSTSVRHTLYEKLIAACRPGASTRELLAAYETVGEPIPPMPIAHGLGLGFDPPVVSETLSAAGEDDRLEAGMVLAITGYVWREGVGAVFRQDTVHVTAAGAGSADAQPILAGLIHQSASAIARPAARPENMQPPRKVPSRAL